MERDQALERIRTEKARTVSECARKLAQLEAAERSILRPVVPSGKPLSARETVSRLRRKA